MSWVRIWIHLVFCTKNRSPILHEKEVRLKLFRHIKENTIEKEIWLDCINGYSEHAHCLLSLGREQNISKVAQLIKGNRLFGSIKADYSNINLAGRMIIGQLV